MVLELRHLFENPGEELPFDCKIDLSGFESGGGHPLQKPVQARGTVRNTAGVVLVTLDAVYTLDTQCDRCLDFVSRERRLRSEHVAVLALNGEEDDDFLVLPDAKLCVEELVYADVVLDLPGKILCRADCKGLCPECGVNRNHETCSCARASGDPRLQALRDLLGGAD